MATTVSEKSPLEVGPYQLLDRVGKGGMGSVYKAVDRQTGGVVAVKILRPDLAQNTLLMGRFLQEFKAATKLDHPNIVRALDAGTDGAFSYLVMEYVDGQSLGKMLTRVKRLPEGPAVRIITQVAQALHYAHKRRVIHRDVKPDNILIRTDGLAKLADFGLAKDVEEGHGLTRSASTLGTPHFMAPEQYADAKRVGVQGDVYSLGATLYAAVTGRLPFADVSSLAALAKKVRGEIPSPRQIVPGLSEPLDMAVRRAMAPDLTKRPATCLDFVKLLPAAAQWAAAGGKAGAKPTPPPKPAAERRGSPRRDCVVGATCVVNTSLFGGGPDGQESWPGVVRDVSAGGLGVVLARRFESGTVLTVELDGGLRKEARRLLVKVVRVKDEGLGHWRLGCQFVTAVEGESLAVTPAPLDAE
jgi:serine/threonine protein kinase